MMPNVGDLKTREVTVVADMAAKSSGKDPGEAYPAVLSTPSLVSEMERAAAALLQDSLGEGQVSVGVAVDISHLAPTPIGHQLRSHARFAAREGKLFCFDVWSEDASGVVGTGKHSRAIVEIVRIESAAAGRLKAFPVPVAEKQ